MAQLDAIRYEIRSLSLMNPGPMTRRLMENSPEPTTHSNGILSSTIHSIYFSSVAFHFSKVVIVCLLLLLDDFVPEKQEEKKAKNVLNQVILLTW